MTNNKYINRSGENHHAWKGEFAKYYAKHEYIRRNHGEANKCEKEDQTCLGRFEWSNKDHKYSRDIKHWQQLCRSHHKKYDLEKFNQIVWNKGYRKYPDLYCSWCGKIFHPEKVSSRFCSKNCVMFYRAKFTVKKEGLL